VRIAWLCRKAGRGRHHSSSLVITRHHSSSLVITRHRDLIKTCPQASHISGLVFETMTAAFGVAWFRPADFRKVIIFVGSFTDIRGEHIYPELVEESPRKPIRLFMQDGRNDHRRPDNLKMDWFYQNVRLKDALEKKGYDLNYTWGIGNHGQKQGGSILPGMMRWLWRDHAVSSDPNDSVERSFLEAAH
jgi:hypothetical protein